MPEETFGQRFARLRKEKGYTQETIAEKLKVSPQAVSKWETDSSLPDITLLSSISDLLGVTTDELLGRKAEEAKVVTPQSEEEINKRILRIKINSQEGDIVKVNLPISLVRLMIDSGAKISSNKELEAIDFKQILMMVDKGTIGHLVDIQSGDGDVVSIYVE
jgi:transcriptional regulator with XRE-family HTH domain